MTRVIAPNVLDQRLVFPIQTLQGRTEVPQSRPPCRRTGGKYIGGALQMFDGLGKLVEVEE